MTEKTDSVVIKRISHILWSARDGERSFPATTLYNEGWLLWLILDWFFRQAESSHTLSFNSGARWFAEGRLPSPFLARYRGDHLAEGWTNADGVIGQFTVGDESGKANVKVNVSANQLLIVEAKVFSRLSSGVSNARYFDQAARNVACLAELLDRSGSGVGSFESLGFFVLAPNSQLEEGIFAKEVNKDSIREKVQVRVREYQEPSMDEWFQVRFLPVLEKAKVGCISWEEIIEYIGSVDVPFGEEMTEFYARCLRFNGSPKGGN